MPRFLCPFVPLVVLVAGCGDPKLNQSSAVPADGAVAGDPSTVALVIGSYAAASDPEKVRDADVSILFVGNSHTSMHDLPGIVCGMIRFGQPKKTVYAHAIGAEFLEAAANSPACREEIEGKSWKFVVLQAQKISVSGKYEYSRKGGLDLARLGKARGAGVVFYPEWGLRGKPGDGARQEKVYREMAREAAVDVAPVARAWDLALAARPELPLHSDDGNHQSRLGAFLTACVLVGRITGDSPAALAAYPYPGADENDRKFLAETAAKALAEKEPVAGTP